MSIALDLEMHDECLKAISIHLDKIKSLKIDYVGYREFYYDGTSLAFCTNKGWYKVLYNRDIEVDMSIHYAKELMSLNKTGYNFIIRTLSRAKNRFLKELLKNDMCNSLIIYRKEPDIIRMYSFIAHKYYQAVLDYFVTDRDLFVGLVDLYKDNLTQILQKEKYHPLRKTLFNKAIAAEIFSHKSDINSVRNVQGLTVREVECIPFICGGATDKDIAEKLNISPRTVSYHIANIKKKLKVNNRFGIKDYGNY